MRKAVARLASLVIALAVGGPMTYVTSPAHADTGGLIWPASGVVSQNAAEHNASESEFAIDIASNAANNPVVAAATGVVVVASTGGNSQCHSANAASNGLGNYITLRHQSANGTTYTTYAHLASEQVGSGQGVAQGQQIGIMGNTGCSTGQHTHFAVSTCQGYFNCSEWSSPDPADGTGIARGTEIANSFYVGVGGGSPADGSFVSYQGNVYRLAGGAPLYVSSWTPFGGPQPTTGLTDGQWAALRAYPVDGTVIRTAQNGEIYVVAGGAPLYVSTCAVTCNVQTNIDQWDVDNAGGNPAAHLRAYPVDGTFVNTSASLIYRFAGGAALRITSWTPFGGAQPSPFIDQWDIDNAGAPAAHVRPHPADGTVVRSAPSGLYFKFSTGFCSPSAASGAAVVVNDDSVACDVTAPTVAITSKPANPVASSSASFAFTGSDAGSPPVTFVCSLDGTAAAGCTSPAIYSALSNGVHTFTVTGSDKAGNTAAPVSYTWRVDTLARIDTGPPVDTEAPTVGLTRPTAVATLASSVKVSWTGSDTGGSGVAKYQVRYTRAAYSGRFTAWAYPSSWQALTTTSLTHSGLVHGYDYCYSVRAIDRAGNHSPWSVKRCTAVALDDRSVASTTSGWTRVTSTAWWNGTATTTKTLNATLTRPGAQLDRVGIVATKCSSCGIVGIYVGRTLIGKINLHAAGTAYRQVILLPKFTYRTGTVIVKALTSGKTIQLDGLTISRT
jgi:murein DD-endopeptidase MepM/ murein hydrolase activator NlpD